jgi:ribosomal protein S18 acetylase RimI-like enzyme
MLTEPIFTQVSSYSFDQLADIYNQTRVDYIVPMPMNGKRMAEYIRDYDINLDRSTVSLNAKHQPIGIVMLGVRDERSWITRLGILPNQRGQKVGQALVELSIEKSIERHVVRIQLEVITGNQPAYQLFLKLGFEEVRELLVIRRPPGAPTMSDGVDNAEITTIRAAEIPTYWAQRDNDSAWTEETASLLRMSQITGFCAALPSGEHGWLTYQLTPFQLTHIVINPGASAEMMQTLINQLHKQHPRHDTKLENLPRNHPAWPIFHAAGYLEVFSRIEMYRHTR